MPVAVISEQMPIGVDSGDDMRMRVDIFPDAEKRRRDFFGLKQIEQHRRRGGIGSIIKRQGNLPAARHATANGFAIKLHPGIDHAPGTQGQVNNPDANNDPTPDV